MMGIENTPEWQEYRLSKESIKDLEFKIKSYQSSLAKAIDETESYRKIAHAHCAELGHEYLKNEMLKNVKIGTERVEREVPDDDKRRRHYSEMGGPAQTPTATKMISVDVPVYEKQYVKICEFCKHSVGRKAEIKYV